MHTFTSASDSWRWRTGADETALIVGLACYFLTAEPQYFQQLRHELEKAFPDPLGTLPLNTLNALPLLNGVLNEALRICLPYFFTRVVPAGGTRIDGRYVPGGTIVALATYSQHMSPENFSPEPEVRSYPRLPAVSADVGRLTDFCVCLTCAAISSRALATWRPGPGDEDEQGGLWRVLVRSVRVCSPPRTRQRQRQLKMWVDRSTHVSGQGARIPCDALPSRSPRPGVRHGVPIRL